MLILQILALNSLIGVIWALFKLRQYRVSKLPDAMILLCLGALFGVIAIYILES